MARARNPSGGAPRRRRRKCYQWMYRAYWDTPDGRRIYSTLHAVVTSSPDNYQQASALARRELLTGLTDSERALVAGHADARFYLRREGPIIEVPGPC